MKFLGDWNFWLSISTVIIAVYAIYQTHKQIKISNKQSLFDRRISIYTILIKLVQTYKEYPKNDFARMDKHLPLSFHIDLIWLTNTFFLFPIREEIKEPTQEPVYDVTNKFNELDEIAEASTLIFSGREAEIASSFVRNYRELLFKMLDYRKMKKTLDKYLEETGIPYEKAKEDFCEKDFREEVIIAYDDLKNSFDEVEKNNVMKKLRKQIKL